MDDAIETAEFMRKKTESQIEKARQDAEEAEDPETHQDIKNRIKEMEGNVKYWDNVVKFLEDVKKGAEAQAEEEAKAEETKAEENAGQARKETEALNGVPDWTEDRPQDARDRGYRVTNGTRVDRQGIVPSVQGKEVEVKFSDKVKQKGRVVVVDASAIQPSHMNGQPNAGHFIPEAQPKDRTDQASVASSEKMAAQMNPEEITSSVTAYTGAPSVNARCEVIQGNNRSAALKLMWEAHPDVAARYKQYLMDHAEEFGLDADEIAKMEHPVLVNMMDVDDAKAIELGQYDVKDTESGGTERIKAGNVAKKMGNEMRSFASILLSSDDADASLSQLIDQNGVKVLEWMNAKGFITPTQYKSAFNDKGELTAEARNDLKNILYQHIFKGGNERIEEMFNRLPVKAQRAILATAFRDFDSDASNRMLPEIQNSIMAFNELMQDQAFANARNMKDAQSAIMAWMSQYKFDEATGESYLPTDKYSNFALHLAAMYKVQTQGFIQDVFNQMYDLIQGTKEKDLFNQDTLDNTPRTLAQAIKEVLNIDYNGKYGSDALAVRDKESQGRRQGSEGNAQPDERGESGEGNAERGTGAEGESGKSETSVHQPQSEREGSEQDSDVGRKGNGGRVDADAAGGMEGTDERSRLRMFEEKVASPHGEHTHDSKRNRRKAESERLVDIAKEQGLFVPIEDTTQYGERVSANTGESVVYINRESGKVIKVKDPYAKASMKSGVQPEDAVFEHLVHNLLFPETAYTLVGVSEKSGEVRLILSQDYIQSNGRPTKQQIEEALAKRGLKPDGKYSYGNEFVSVTDVEGDNVVLGKDGQVYFIDPIIRFKKPLSEILNAYDSHSTEKHSERSTDEQTAVETEAVAKEKEGGEEGKDKDWENPDKLLSLENRIIKEAIKRAFPDANQELIDQVFRDLNEKPLTDDDRKAMQMMGEAYGIKVKFVDSLKMNGKFDKATRTLYVAMNSEHPLAETFGHEFTHAVRTMSENDYIAMRDAVLAAYDNGNRKGLLDFIDMKYAGYAEDERTEEFVCDKVGEMINSKHMAQAILRQCDQSTIGKMRDAVNRMLAAARGVGSSVMGFLGVETKKPSEAERKMENLRQTILDAYGRAHEKQAKAKAEEVRESKRSEASSMSGNNVENSTNEDDPRVKKYRLTDKEKDDSIKRIDERIAELNRQKKEQSLKSNVGNSAESHQNDGYLPDDKDTAGAQSVAPSPTKVNKKFPPKDDFVQNLANFISDLPKNKDVNASNFIKQLFAGIGMTPHGNEVQKSEYIRFTSVDGQKTTVRLSDHSGNAISIIKKGGRADKGYSIVIQVEGSPEAKFKANNHSEVMEFVYDSSDKSRLELIAKGVFDLIDRGEYTDIAHADHINVSPRIEEKTKFSQRMSSSDEGRWERGTDNFDEGVFDVGDVSKQPTTEFSKDMAYRETDINEMKDILESGVLRELPEGKTVEGGSRIKTTKGGRRFELGRPEGRSHGGKGFSKGIPWTMVDGRGSTAGGTAQKILIGVDGSLTDWKVGFHGSYSDAVDFSEIEHGRPLFLPFNSDREVDDIYAEDLKFWAIGKDGKFYEIEPKGKVKESKRTTSSSELALRDAVVDRLRRSGIGVSLDEKEGQRVLDWVNGMAREMKVYHGSHADFDHFDHSFMNSGEGAQAYGWGTYVTEVEGIGRTYAKQIAESHSKLPAEYAQKRLQLQSATSDAENLKESIEAYKNSKKKWEDLLGDTEDDPEHKARLERKIKGCERHIEDYQQDLNSIQKKIEDINDWLEKYPYTPPTRHLYTVEIPDDTGSNYLDWDGAVTEEHAWMAAEALAAHPKEAGQFIWENSDMFGLTDRELLTIHDHPESIGKDDLARVLARYLSGIPDEEDLYRKVQEILGSDKNASLALNEAGIVGMRYPADYMSGGRADGAKNYVIFNEDDAQITDHVRFFRGKDGEAYGFTVGGKIYLDPKKVNAETPIHEYAHLWSTALQQKDAKAWGDVVRLMKGTGVWDDVRQNYPELKTDDEIADEVLATYSGQRGAERLREEMRKVGESDGSLTEKAAAISALERVRNAISRFWRKVAEMLGFRYTKAEDVADHVLSDLLEGRNPMESMSEEDIDTDSTLRFHKETDEDTLKRLNSEPTVKVYRAMQVIDGKLYPPMAAKIGRNFVEPNELGVWIRADENPDLAVPDIDRKTGKQKVDKNGEPKWKFKLDKGGKDASGKKATDVIAAYNPYWHTSRSPLNDQFKSAWIRPNIVIVECEVPESELTSGYRAERAKDSVGEVDWKSGSVSGEVFKQTGNSRKVILSRWCKPVRILSDAEVAQKSKDFIGDADVVIPENVLTPKQKVEFEKAGLKIGAPEKGVNKSEQIEEAIRKGLMVDNTLSGSHDTNGVKESKRSVTPEMDKAYMDAVERGDMETAQRMVDEAAEKSGYANDESWKMSHEAPNSKDDFSVSMDDVSEMFPDMYGADAFRYYGEMGTGAYESISAIRSVKGNPDAMVTIYRAVPKTVKEGKVRNGDWVTLSEDYARDHGIMNLNGYRIIKEEVPAKYLYTDGNSVNEFGYDDGSGYVYSNTKNNRKLADPVTYDDNGNVIPLSQRFNTRKDDVRYSKREAWKNPVTMSDEEKAARGNQLINAPAIDVKSNQIVKTEDKSARKVAEEWWMDIVKKKWFEN